MDGGTEMISGGRYSLAVVPSAHRDIHFMNASAGGAEYSKDARRGWEIADSDSADDIPHERTVMFAVSSLRTP